MIEIKPFQLKSGTYTVPGDKSLSHRALLLSALFSKTMHIKNLNPGEDVLTTLDCLKKLEISFEKRNNEVKIFGDLQKCKNIEERFDCRNSGTTLSLFLGLHHKKSYFIGDESLSSRSFKPQCEILESLGSQFEFVKEKYYLPFYMKSPKNLLFKASIPSCYNLKSDSAQVKSMLLVLKEVYGASFSIRYKIKTRDHTERFLNFLNTQDNNSLIFKIPGDFSSAAFLITACLLSHSSEIKIENVGLNPTRTLFLALIKEMGGDVRFIVEQEEPEPWGSIYVKASKLKGVHVNKDWIPRMIDEIPCLALLALVAEGETVVRGAERLRNKESDRIKAICENFKKCGVHIEEYQGGFRIKNFRKNTPPSQKQIRVKENTVLTGYEDHRIIMMLSLLGMLSQRSFFIDEGRFVKVSYPQYFEDILGYDYNH
ncbi:MAG: 3-phosphoshikimate 1-carboxyvinyltransferase [Deltaproteobacteria bacterium]|nr:3-phosphoshikimate 1-carboxyvinyltransferase [Deltaproteobacteria bacterium]